MISDKFAFALLFPLKIQITDAERARAVFDPEYAAFLLVPGRDQTIVAGILLTCSANALAFDVFAVIAPDILVRFDSATPGTLKSILSIGGLGAGENIVGIAIRPADQKLYALSKDAANAGRLYMVDRSTGAAALVGTLNTALNGVHFGMNFNPTVDRLRVVSDSGMNIRVNPATGVIVSIDTALNPGTPHVVSVAYTNTFVGAPATTLYDIDSSSDLLLIQNPPNNGTLTTVGALGVDTGDTLGFGILSIMTGTFTATNFAYATLSAGGTVGFYSVDLTTGASTLIGDADRRRRRQSCRNRHCDPCRPDFS